MFKATNPIAALVIFDDVVKLQKLGEASHFAADFDEPRCAVEVQTGRLFGAHARHRAAKAALERRRRDGVIVCSSTYESIDTILRLQDDDAKAGAPVLRLAFDGALDTGSVDRLRALLYYP